MAEEVVMLVLLAKSCPDLGIRDCSSDKRNRSNPSTVGPFAFGYSDRTSALFSEFGFTKLAVNSEFR
jgi:hypothetical protein